MQNENDHGVGVQAAMEISPRPQQELHAFGEHNQCSIDFFFCHENSGVVLYFYNYLQFL
jgi:hypothetical protein